MNKVDIFIEFVKSELAKNNSVSFWACVVLFSGGSIFLTWLYLTKISFKLKLNEASVIKRKNKQLTNENKRLKKEISELKEENESLVKEKDDLNNKLKSIQYAYDTYSNDGSTEDPALKKFSINQK